MQTRRKTETVFKLEVFLRVCVRACAERLLCEM